MKKRAKKPSLRVLDQEFSRFIRARDDWTCQRCGTRYPENCGASLQNSHFIGRAHRATRWDPLNCDSFCRGCHQVMETHKATVYRDWKFKQLGILEYFLLIQRGQSVKKWTADELKTLRSEWVT